MFNIGIVGGTGYTGVELLRLLANHPDVEISVITSRSNAGTRVSDMFPNLRQRLDVDFTAPDVDSYRACDLVFFATPNKVAMNQAGHLLDAGVRVVDLAADFRLKDLDVWSHYYGGEHACPSLVEQAIYGLPEMNREAIRDARLVANPGCYVTAVTLGLLPLLAHQQIDPATIIADGKSGVSGAGRGANVAMLMAEAAESVKAYASAGHRHYPEIRQNLRQLVPGADLVFVPHLMPMIRGIHATLYAELLGDADQLQAQFEEYYQDEPFVDVMPPGSHPETRSVKGANTCRLAVTPLPEAGRVVVLSVVDNLVKGAAGQAVQNMNLMLGIEETRGLEALGMIP
jgi:N-acetyl-gamma-glutamyl-phosphate reductase